MSDILQVIPEFKTAPYAHILPSLDKASISTVDLITLAPQEVAKRAQVPPGEVAKLSEALVLSLQGNIAGQKNHIPLAKFLDNVEPVLKISTLDPEIDASLDGGIRPGYVTEITGESGVGKTQFLLTLILAVQLPPPRGLGGSAIYISTEAALSTSRLKQLLQSHPELSTLPISDKPTLDGVLSIQTPDLESQEHIIRYQVPVAIQRRNVRLVVIDSIAANYRAEFERPNQGDTAGVTPKKPSAGLSASDRRTGQSLAERKPQLVQLGAFLRNLAHAENVAIVASNQIADRFAPVQTFTPSHPQPSASPNMTPDPLTLDHQQRWFTGWGDLPAYTPGHSNLKTPSLGLVWTNQISARIALVKENQPVGGQVKRRRWMRVVFAPWAGPTVGLGIEYDISTGGVKAVTEKTEETADSEKETNSTRN